MGINNAVTDKDGRIRVEERINESSLMIRKLVLGGVDVKEAGITDISLEDYYLEVTGGKYNG